MSHQVDVGISDAVLRHLFNGAFRHHHLAARLIDGAFRTFRIERQALGQVFAPQQAPGCGVDDQPGRRGQHGRIPRRIEHTEIAHVKGSFETLVPGLQFDGLAPAWHGRKLHVHARQHPGRPETLQILKAKTERAGRNIRNLLGHVHKGPRLEIVGHISGVAGHCEPLDGFLVVGIHDPGY